MEKQISKYKNITKIRLPGEYHAEYFLKSEGIAYILIVKQSNAGLKKSRVQRKHKRTRSGGGGRFDILPSVIDLDDLDPYFADKS